MVRRGRDRFDSLNAVIAVSFAAIGVVGLVWAWDKNGVDVELTGIDNRGAVTTQDAETLLVEFRITPTDRLEDARFTFDGEDAADDVELTDTGFTWNEAAGLDEGDYELAVHVPRLIGGTRTWTLYFAVDDTPPQVELPDLDAGGIDEPVVVELVLSEAGTVKADGADVEVDSDHSFELAFDRPPAGPVELELLDRAGNLTVTNLDVPVNYPGGQGVHVSGPAWSNDARRQQIVRLIDEGTINAVELSLKDECGEVGWSSTNPLASQVSATRTYYDDLAETVSFLHDKGVRVVGRIVAFRDPLLTRWAWAHGNPDWVLQDTADNPWPAYGGGECTINTADPALIGGFSNFAHPDVWQYNLDLALEAAAAGIDEIVYDYVRRPEGDITRMQALGLVGPASSAIVEFLTLSEEQLRGAGVFQGALVFGISARDPDAVAQDVPLMAAHLDYVSPMVYPFAWGDDFYNVPDPESQPYDIVFHSINHFKEQVEGTGAVVVPWLQDFTSEVPYGVNEVQAQIEAARAAGICDWFLWDPDVTYTPGVGPTC